MDHRSLMARVAAMTGPTCKWCEGPLGDSVSDDFCSPEHQQAWTAQENDVVEIEGYREAASPAVMFGDAMNTARGDVAMADALHGLFADHAARMAEIDAEHAFRQRLSKRRFWRNIAIIAVGFVLQLTGSWVVPAPWGWAFTGAYLLLCVAANVSQVPHFTRKRDDAAWEKRRAQRAATDDGD